MTDLHFEQQAVRVRLRSFKAELTGALELAASDFAGFKCASDPSRTVDIVIYLVGKTPLQKNRRPLPIKVFKTAMCTVHGLGKHRVCDYGDVMAESRWIGRTRCFWISGSGRNNDLVREIIVAIFLSSLGEELDRRGFHRVHALGFEYLSKRSLLIGPSGAGKSTLGCLIHRDFSGARLFSDESPLLKKTCVYPFALRIALLPEIATLFGLSGGIPFARKIHRMKLLFPFPLPALAQPGKVDFIFIARPHRMRPMIRSLNRFSAVGTLVQTIVVGLGLAQMAEWMLRFDLRTGLRLARIACSRAQTAFSLLFGAEKIYEFDLCEDARLNAETLSRFLTASETLPIQYPSSASAVPGSAPEEIFFKDAK